MERTHQTETLNIAAAIPGFPGYLATSDGRIWSARVGGFLSPIPCREYTTVNVYSDGIGHRVLVHRLVLFAFWGQPAGDQEAHHIDRDPSNNHVSNLRWLTQSEHLALHGHGEDNSQAKLNATDVEHIRHRATNGESFVSIARDFSVCASHVGQIVKHAKWKYI